MVFTTIFAYFLDIIFIFAFFSLEIWIKHSYNTYRITHIFILLSSYPAFVPNVIFEGKAEFKPNINHITVDVCVIPSQSSTTTFAFAPAVRPKPHAPAWLRAPPLCLGMWAHSRTPLLLKSEDAVGAAPPLFLGDLLTFDEGMGD